MVCAGPATNDDGVPWDQDAAQRFGAVLRASRQGKGLSQEALAWRAGITKNQVQLLEAGRGSARDRITPSNPRMTTIFGLAEALDLRVSELLGER